MMEAETEFITKDGLTAHSRSGKFSYIFGMFQTSFPDIAERVRLWSRNDGSSIELEMANHQKYIYTYHNAKDWCFQTKENYLKMLDINKAKRGAHG